MSAQKVPVGILISGRGSNMAAMIEAAKAPDYPARIVLVMSNRPEAPGLDTARAAGIPVMAIDNRPYGKDREAHDKAMDAALRAAGVQVVALAGYMRIISPWLVQAWSGRMINIHPSLLPAYAGLNTHERALEAGETEHGCTVHLVTEGVDEGPVLGQARVPVLLGDTPEMLAARVLQAEHRLYPQALAEFCEGL